MSIVERHFPVTSISGLVTKMRLSLPLFIKNIQFFPNRYRVSLSSILRDYWKLHCPHNYSVRHKYVAERVGPMWVTASHSFISDVFTAKISKTVHNKRHFWNIYLSKPQVSLKWPPEINIFIEMMHCHVYFWLISVQSYVNWLTFHFLCSIVQFISNAQATLLRFWYGSTSHY